jgi:phosphonate transport system permease protein
VLLALLWAARRAEFSLPNLASGAGNMRLFVFGDPARQISGFFPPAFDRLPEYGRATLDTLAIALVGTALSLLLALPLGVLGSRNGSALLGGPRPLQIAVYHGARRTMDALRAVNELIFALMFVSAVGIGPFAGVLALAVHTGGVLGKLISEAVEAVDPGPVEAISATGAGRLQVLSFAVVPQVAPHFVSYLLYRLETNVRAATVVGMTGAGGIGWLLWEAMRGYELQRACAALLLVVALVVAIDQGCARLRARVT